MTRVRLQKGAITGALWRAGLGSMHEHTAACQSQSRVGGGTPPRGGNACNRMEEHAACGALLKTWCMDWAGPCLSACGRAGLTPHAPMQRSRTMRGECWFRQDAAGCSILQGPAAVRACGKLGGSLHSRGKQSQGRAQAGTRGRERGSAQGWNEGAHGAGTHRADTHGAGALAERGGRARWPSALRSAGSKEGALITGCRWEGAHSPGSGRSRFLGRVGKRRVRARARARVCVSVCVRAGMRARARARSTYRWAGVRTTGPWRACGQAAPTRTRGSVAAHEQLAAGGVAAAQRGRALPEHLGRVAGRL